MENKAGQSGHRSLPILALQGLHAGVAELFLFYRRMVQSGWFEVLECQPSPDEPAVCPVRQLIAPQSIQKDKDILI